MEFDLEQVIMTIKIQLGELTRSKDWGAEYYQVPISKRHEAMLLLVDQAIAYGKPREYFTRSRRDEIVVEFIPRKNSKNPSSYNGFKSGALAHLNMAIEERYGNVKIKPTIATKDAPKREDVVSSTSNKLDLSLFDDDPPMEDTMDPEMAALLGLKEDE